MPKYYGCPCEGCGKPLTLRDDIVVCPDCGAPYHRDCYEKLGACIHAQNKSYEWKFPYQDSELCTCPNCGERTLRSEARCRCCGVPLSPEERAGDEPKESASASSREQNGSFDYDNFYAQNQRTFYASAADAVHRTYQAAFGKDELMDGISYTDWVDYIGPSAPSYMSAYSRMQLQHSKVSISFSALLFGPFYFFYRKAWKPAFAFLAAELVLAIPTLLVMMQASGSTFMPNLSDSQLLILSRVASALSFVLMVIRGLYAKWFYRKSSVSRIRHIRDEFPDPEQRRAVLSAQGGVSWAAVFGAFVLLMVIGSASSLLLGPDLNALLNAIYG